MPSTEIEDFKDFDWKILPKVDLLRKSSLPDSPGIYFISWGDELYYIGVATKSLKKRWAAHHRYNQSYNASENTAQIHYFAPDTSDLEDAGQWLEDVERQLIRSLRPILNRTKLVPGLPAPRPTAEEKFKVETFLAMTDFKRLLLWCEAENTSRAQLCVRALEEELALTEAQFMADLARRAADKGMTVEELEQQIYQEAGLSFGEASEVDSSLEPEDKASDS